MKKEVTVIQNTGSKVYYEVAEYGGKFYIKRYKSGTFTASYYDIGTATSQGDALALIKSDAGDVDKVEIKDK
jgi:hypothetical protein